MPPNGYEKLKKTVRPDPDLRILSNETLRSHVSEETLARNDPIIPKRNLSNHGLHQFCTMWPAIQLWPATTLQNKIKNLSTWYWQSNAPYSAHMYPLRAFFNKWSISIRCLYGAFAASKPFNNSVDSKNQIWCIFGRSIIVYLQIFFPKNPTFLTIW